MVAAAGGDFGFSNLSEFGGFSTGYNMGTFGGLSGFYNFNTWGGAPNFQAGIDNMFNQQMLVAQARSGDYQALQQYASQNGTAITDPGTRANIAAAYNGGLDFSINGNSFTYQVGFKYPDMNYAQHFGVGIKNITLPLKGFNLSDFFAPTGKIKTGIEYENINTIIGAFSFSTFSSVSTTGGDHILNHNTTQFNSQVGSKISHDYNLNLFVYKFKFTSGLGIEQEIGTASWNLNLGLSLDKGISFGGAVNGHGFDSSYRPNGVGLIAIGVSIFQPEWIPVILRTATR